MEIIGYASIGGFILSLLLFMCASITSTKPTMHWSQSAGRGIGRGITFLLAVLILCMSAVGIIAAIVADLTKQAH